MEPILKIENLCTWFQVNAGVLHAVDNVNIELEATKTLGVVGESGCGKSTLGKTIMRLEDPTSGKILFKGKDIANYQKHDLKMMRKDIQMIFQDPFSSLDPRMSIKESIAEPLRIYRLYKDKADLNKQVETLMDTVGLARRLADSYPHELDGGRRQRVGIARALSVSPSFIVCDEPVSALDVSIQAQVINLLEDLQKERGLTYMFISHDLSVVRHISDEICVMYLGQIVEQCSTEDLFETPKHPYTKALLSAIPEPSLDKKRERILLKGELSSPINPKNQCRFAPRCPLAKEQCFKSCPELKDAGEGHLCACHLVS